MTGSLCRLSWNTFPRLFMMTLARYTKKFPHLMQPIKSCEIRIVAFHYLERFIFDGHEIQHDDLVHLTVADTNKRRDCAPQV